MDFAKLLQILVRNELTLVRVDQLPDKYEGLFPERSEEAFIEWLRVRGTVAASDREIHLKNFRQWFQGARGTMFVSCWHLGEIESEAMWRIYCGSHNGVAIKLIYGALRDSVNHTQAVANSHSEVFIGLMRYIDFRTDVFPQSDSHNSFDLVMHKRREFKYENEVRIAQMVLAPGDAKSRAIPWDAASIEGIVISPYADAWYGEIVRDTVSRLLPKLTSRIFDSLML